VVSLNLSSVTRWGLNLLALLAGVIALHLGHTIFIPTVIALLLAAMLWPAARWLHTSLRFTWTFSCLLVVMGLVFLNLLITLGFFLTVPKFLQNLPGPQDKEGQIAVYNHIRSKIERISPVPLDADYLPQDAEKSRVFQYVQETLKGNYIANALLQLLYYANMWLWQWVLIMFILLFMLVEGPMLTRRVVEIFGPSEEAKAHAVNALSDMAHQVRTYLVWRTIINFGMGSLVGVVYEWFGLRQPWTWAILTAVLCYVPYLGPLAAGILPVIDAFIVLTPLHALAILAFYVLLITLEGYLIVPVVMGRSMELNATTVMLACLFWELVWGLPGLFLAMPLMAAIKAICTHIPDGQPWANLMSTRKEEVRPVEELLTPDLDKTQVLLPEETKELDAPRTSAVDQ
jgi:predicted PurR-regulated permease PerM